MKKFFYLIKLVAVSIFFISFAFCCSAYSANLVEKGLDALKIRLEQQLSEVLSREVSIGKIRGMLFYEAEIYDLKIAKGKTLQGGEAFYAKKITFTYNPIMMAKERDVLSGISKIDLEGPILHIDKDSPDTWAFFGALFASPSQKEKAGVSFSPKISVKGGSIDYIDRTGLSKIKSTKVFKAGISSLSGLADLKKSPNVVLDFSGDLLTEGRSSTFGVKGGVNTKAMSYKISVDLKGTPLKEWLAYLVDMKGLDIAGGEMDSTLTFSGPPIKKGKLPVEVDGSIYVSGLSGSVLGYKAREISGNIGINKDETLKFNNLKGNISGVNTTINGSVSGLNNLNLKLNLVSDFDKLISFFPALKAANPSGKSSGEIFIKGPIGKQAISGNIKVTKGSFYSQNFDGNIGISLDNGLLVLELKNLDMYSGKAKGFCKLDLRHGTPIIDLDLNGEKIDLNLLSQKNPETSGKADLKLQAKGTLSAFAITGNATFTNAFVFEQPIEKASIRLFSFKGLTRLDEFLLSSKKAEVKATGTIDQNLNYVLNCNSTGIRFKGETILGNTRGTINSFKGQLGGSLKDLLKNPYSSISKASGEAEISDGFIGDQVLTNVKGNMVFGDGMLNINELKIFAGTSSVEISGAIGVGAPTDLNIVGEKVDLADLKILSQLLPNEFGSLAGIANLNIKIFGEIPKGTEVKSVDTFLDLSAKGNLSVENGFIAGEKVIAADTILTWDKRIFKLEKLYFKTKDSEINLKSTSGVPLLTSFNTLEAGAVDAEINGHVNLKNLRAFTKKYGTIRGKIFLTSKITGTFSSPKVVADFDVKDLKYNAINLAGLSGSVTFSDGNLAITNPIVIAEENDQYVLSGNGVFLYGEEPFYNLKFEAKKGSLATFVNLAQNVAFEIQKKKLISADKQSVSSLQLKKDLIPNSYIYTKDENLLLYKADGEEEEMQDCYLRSFSFILEDLKVHEEKEAPKYLKNTKGKFSGALFIKGKGANLAADLSLMVEKATLEGYSIDKAEISLSFVNKEIKVNSFLAEKAGGKLSLSGSIGLESKISLEASSSDFPMDFLSNFFPGKIKEGKLDLKSNISGTIVTPEATLELFADNIKAEGFNIDKLAGKAFLKNNLLFVDIESDTKEDKSSIKGSTPIKGSGEIDLASSLNGDGLSLLTFFLKDIDFIKGDGAVNLKISGSNSNPKIDGTISLKDTAIRIRPLSSNIEKITAEIDIKDSQAKIGKLAAVWRGKITARKENEIEIFGSAKLEEIFSKNGRLNLKTKLKDCSWYMETKTLYKGDIELRDFSLSGPIYFFTKKPGLVPKLKGNIELANGMIRIPEMKGGEIKFLPYLALDLSLSFSKNISIVGGDTENILSTNLINLILNLEAETNGLKIRGNLSQPSLLGEVLLKRGNINIFNRDFKLMSEDEQKRLYGANTEFLRPNSAIFKGGSGKEGSLPDLSLVAQVKVKNYVAPPAGSTSLPEMKYVLVIAKVKGMPFASDPEKGISLKFDAFDTDQAGAQASLGNYTDEDIKVMLLPDFVKSSMGVTAKDQGGAGGLVAEYLSSRLNAILLRDFERQVEKSLELESFSVEYNFGKDLKKMMGSDALSEMPGQTEETFAVSFAKRIFERFYIDVRYSQIMVEAESENQSYFNYRLIYKLGGIWSIVYFQEQFPTAAKEYPDWKLTLNGEYSF